MDGHPHSDVGVQLRSNDCQEIGSAETHTLRYRNGRFDIPHVGGFVSCLRSESRMMNCISETC